MYDETVAVRDMNLDLEEKWVGILDLGKEQGSICDVIVVIDVIFNQFGL